MMVLGRAELRDPSGAVLRLPGNVATLLLARLALPPQRAHAREELVELLWPGVALDIGRNRLRQLLSVLRGLLQPPGVPVLFHADRLTVRLADDMLLCDAARFEAAVRDHQPDAMALYAGELLPGFYEDWVQDERRRLAALAERPEVAAPAPRPGLPRYLTRLLGAESIAARLHEAVLTHRLVTLVGPGGGGKTRLAVEVAQALQDAGEPFQRIDFVPLAACTGAEAMADALLLAFGLPGGTDQPLNALSQALAGRRLLVVLDNCEQLVEAGAPLIAALAGRLPQAHWLITSRRVLGLDGERELVLPALPLPPARAGIDTLARNPALAMLLDRARAVRPDLRLHPGNAEVLAALVRALDGLPLAIELVASRLRSLAPEELLAMLQAQGPAALALLERSGPRSGHDERHASMLKVVRWSWSLLSPSAQALVASLSVFEGGFTVEAASAVHGADARLGLDELVQHSMLRAEPDLGRCTMYEVIREAAAAQLDPARRRALRARQRQWMLQWARALPASPQLRAVRRELRNIAAAFVSAAADAAPGDALALFDALQRALSDISLPPAARAALGHSLQALPAGPARAAAQATLARAAMRAGDSAGAQTLATAALAALPAQGLARAVVLARVAHIRWRLQRDASVSAWLDEALATARAEGALALQASVLSVQGAMRRPQDPAAAATLQREAIAAWQQAADAHGVNTGRYNLAVALGALPDARELALQECARVQADTRAAEDWGQLASACNQRGEILSWLRRWDEAVAAYREGIAVADDALELLPLAYCLWNLPGALAHRREPEAAGRLMGFAACFWAERFGALSATDRHDRRRVQRLVAAQLGAERAEALLAEGAALSLPEAVRLALQSLPSSTA
jgi:predicted ATPase